MNKHGKRKKLEKQKKKKQRQWKQQKKKQDLARRLPYVPEGIVRDILSRLPVKSLMRFKCVCNQWKSLIEEDQSFIDLQFSRSKTARRVSLLRMGELKRKFMMSMELLFSSEEEDDGRIEAMSLWEYPFPKHYWKCVYHTTNGLLCVLSQIDYCVCLYNISTGESTEWVKSTFIKQQEQKEQHLYEDFSLNMFGLGYDPVTKEHKVIALWSYGETKELVCEVLTVGQNSWRRIDVVDLPPPCGMDCSHGYVESVHVNGFICWLDFHLDYREPCLMQFEVGSEKLKKMNILLSDQAFNSYYLYDTLIDIDGQLAVLATCETSIKMCILYAQDKESKTVTSSAATSPICDSYYGIEETFLKPPFDCKKEWSHRHHYIHIPGTDLFMVRCKDDKKSFDYYNWKKKSYGSCKIPLGITLSFGDIHDVIFTPSLFHVN
ncbi:hypothetical protein MKW92_023261 [Papaver armeniacum]|nr:hypothetical protein MKW92_023261 [Papaver armeniacum]